MHNDPVIKQDTEMPVVDEYKFLMVIFDNKLTFIRHLKYIKPTPPRVQQLLLTQNGTPTNKSYLIYTGHWSTYNWTMPLLSTDLPAGPTSKSSTLYITKA